MYSLALIIFVVSEKKAFEHFPIGPNVNICPAVAAILDKFKMAAMSGPSLTLDPMGKMFQNASFLKPLGQLKPNCPGMIIGRYSTKFLFFYADRKFKMAATAGHILTLDPMGKCSNAFFSETTNQTESKLDRNVHCWL
jgi:hypothetical protein